MSLPRKILLTAGPVLLVGLCYSVSMRSELSLANSANARTPVSPDDSAEMFITVPPPHSDTPSAAARSESIHGLQQDCLDRARTLKEKLGGHFNVVVSPPFVLLGDTSPAELQHHFAETIVPSVRALEYSYFETPPTQPISVVLLSNEAAFRAAAKALDHRTVNSLYGYYLDSERRLLVNLATGNGSLAHELTHALANADFPDIPEWFDEGLASLHEQSHFSDDGLQLIGTTNWRLYYLLQAERNGRLRPVSQLIAYQDIRAGHEEIDYAHARSFCTSLQSPGIQAGFCRPFRDGQPEDELGLQALTTLLSPQSLAEIDSHFRDWLGRLHDQVTAERAAEKQD